MNDRPLPLVDEKLAVSLFLESLLRDTEQETKTQTDRDISDVDEVLAEPEKSDEKPASKEQASKLINEIQPVQRLEDQTLLQEVNIPTLPDWSQQPFQALLFKVAGLTLAVPLVELSGVLEWQDEITEMPGHASHYMGLLNYLDKNVPLIDIAELVLPKDRFLKLAGHDPRQRVKRIVLIDNNRWGLACDEVGEVITLNPDDVRWRTNRTRREWLLGTVIEHMCALLDIPGFSTLLSKGR